ncbi:hypothetical protein [Actinomadura flavalba]|uniref:hypothetical protein n=1 Tax=Actinomadura flavalba TaxID=1120938 RepID=UPI00036DF4D9|nr:hypothetical protein [Actinomadura flavalba]
MLVKSVGVMAGAVLVAVAVRESGLLRGESSGTPAQAGRPDAASTERPVRRLIGDGSTADTGPQPSQPTPRRLAPGQRPPQFVVFSWDGAGEDSARLFSKFLDLGRRHNAAQTFFLSGLYALPEAGKHHYRPPGRERGASDIGYLRTADVRRTLAQVRRAWLEGHEIGTHFNGHFCGPGGVGTWTPAQWRSEIRQARWFVKNWKTTTGWKSLPPLPFDYDREMVGGRTPCLEGSANAREAAREMGFRYDSSGVGTQVWPGRRAGLWDLPLQQVPLPGRGFEVLSMDYNYLANQGGSGGNAARGRQMHESLMRGFERAYDGNRAPLIIGNHFEQWNGGVYMDAVEDVMRDTCGREEVRCVSFRQLVDWLDVQDPAVLAELRGLDVGVRPAAWPGGAGPISG